MKFSTQEEYGLRCLLRIAKDASDTGLTIPEISTLEGLTAANVGKILRIMRLGGFIEASRGQNGGYKLAKAPEEIKISEVLGALGGKLYENDFCNDHKGIEVICTNTIDCSIRSLWKNIQYMIDSVLSKITLKDLLGNEEKFSVMMNNLSEENIPSNIKFD